MPSDSPALAPIAALLADGPIHPVAAVVAAELGKPVTPRTVLRWAVTGRRGLLLPTVRGLRLQHCTTASAFRAWLSATSDDRREAS